MIGKFAADAPKRKIVKQLEVSGLLIVLLFPPFGVA